MDYHGTPGNDTIDQAKQSLPADVTIYGEDGDDTITLSNGKAIGGAGNNTITGTGPNAVAVYWDAPTGVSVDLQKGTAVNGYGGTDKLVNIQQVFGSSHDDVLAGNSGDNSFVGMGGSDKIVGGGGNDKVSYFFVKSTDAKITYDAASDTFTVVKNFANDKGTDTLSGISSIEFFGDGSDNTAVYRTDFTSKVKYSLAGIWDALPSGVNAAVIGPFHAQLPLGAAQKNGMVLGGWGFQGGFGGAGQPLAVNAAMLEQQADGSLKLATSKYFSSPATQGIGSVNIADFNGDGRPDIFMAAHNESPFVAVASVAFMSNAAGTFDRVVLTDKVMAHDAELGYVKGVPTIMTRTFSPGDMNPSYQYVNGKFVETIEGGGTWSSGGMSIAMADFDNDGAEDVVVGDFDWGPGYSRQQNDHWKLAVYKWTDLLAGTGAPKATVETYFTGKPAYATVPSLNVPGVAHVPRLWVDDFNHDGRPDILANAGLWTESNPAYPTVLQMLQNKGNFQFADRTDTLNPDVSKAIDEFDYSTQRLDLDHSGIQSYISGKDGALNTDGSTRAPNYLLVNDGTGRLYVALHDEFTQWTREVHQFLLRSADVKAAGLVVGPDIARVDAFLPFQAADGTLNFVAVTQAGKPILTNVMAHYNVTTDFKQDIVISDRNDSKLMRTFAGNDSLADVHANGATRFDGGLGTDTVTYSGKFAGYHLTRQADGSYKVGGGAAGVPQIDDTLLNVERIKFADASVALFNGNAGSYAVTRDANGAVTVTGAGGAEALQQVDRVLFADSAMAFDIAGNAGKAYRVYQAAFNRTPDKGGLGFWISAMDHGASLNSVAEGFVNSSEFKAVYGANPTNAGIVAKIYENVLHRPGEAAGIQFWSGVLDAKASTVAEVLVGFSESAENQAALVGVTANGIAYTLFG